MFMDGHSNTPGQIRVFDSLPWKHQASYRQKEYTPWYFGDASGQSKMGGLTKGLEQMLFVSVDSAGHDVPSHQPDAVLEIFQRWVKNSKLRTLENTRN